MKTYSKIYLADEVVDLNNPYSKTKNQIEYYDSLDALFDDGAEWAPYYYRNDPHFDTIEEYVAHCESCNQAMLFKRTYNVWLGETKEEVYCVNTRTLTSKQK